MAGQTPIRLGVISPSPVVVAGLRHVFDQTDRFRIEGTGRGYDDGLELVESTTPQFLFTSRELLTGSVLKLIAELRSRRFVQPIGVIADSFHESFCAQALKLDVNCFVLLDDELHEVCELVAQAATGEFACSEQLEPVFSRDSNGSVRLARESVINQFSTRQFEVLRQLSHGKSVKEISREMDISVKSVDSHKYRIMKKLDVHDRVELARYAIRQGIVEP